jgi:hypothetical protein
MLARKEAAILAAVLCMSIVVSSGKSPQALAETCSTVTYLAPEAIADFRKVS